MRLSQQEVGLIAAGGAFALLVAWIAWSTNGRGAIPRYDTPSTTVSLAYAPELDTGSHYFHPNYCHSENQQQIWMPHKYPRVSGGNLSTLIHRGMDALKEPSPYDNSWRVQPPGEVMW